MTDASATPATRLLGMQLRHHREQRGLSGDSLALRLGWSPSKISRTEKGRVLIREPDLAALLAFLRVPPAEAARLRELRDTAAAGRGTPGPGYDPGITELLCWAPYVIPAALRTELYARAIIRAGRRIRRYTPSETKTEIINDRALQARLRGQPAAEDAPPLPQLSFACVLDESVLTRRHGATSVMTAQLDYLDQMARLDCADIRILPLDAGGPGIDTGFTLLGYEDDLADAVLLTGPVAAEQITDGSQVTGYRAAFDELADAAADPEQSLDLIKRAANGWA